jgi:hypothetical protein
LYSHDQSILVLPFFILLGVVQSVTGTVRAGVFVLIALANPAIGLSVVNFGRLRIPVNALYLLILFGSVAYLVSVFADLVSSASTRLKEHGASVSVTET